MTIRSNTLTMILDRYSKWSKYASHQNIYFLESGLKYVISVKSVYAIEC